MNKSTKSLKWACLLSLLAEKTQKGEKRKQNGVKDKGKERRKNSPEKKKERWKSENGSMLKELGTLCVRGWVAAFPAVFAVFPNYTS